MSEVVRTMTGESWNGIPVVGYYYEVPTGLPLPSSQFVPKVDFHWSTSGEQQKTDRLVKLSDVMAAFPTEAMSRFYIDCEFDGHNGPLLSLAMVRENGDGIHIEVNVAAMDIWVMHNVLPLMGSHQAQKSVKVYHDEIGGAIRAFIGDCASPVIIADSPVDIARFCRALSTGPDGGWASADYPRMTFEVHNVDCYPTDLPGAVQHNAWWDAMALRHKLITPGAQS